LGLSATPRFGGGEGRCPLQRNDGIGGRGGMRYMERGALLGMRNRIGRRHISSGGRDELRNGSPCSPILYRFWFQCLDSNRLNSPSGRNPRTMATPSYKSGTALDQLCAIMQRRYRHQSAKERSPRSFVEVGCADRLRGPMRRSCRLGYGFGSTLRRCSRSQSHCQLPVKLLDAG